jgi:hypothetical protein
MQQTLKKKQETSKKKRIMQQTLKKKRIMQQTLKKKETCNNH